LGTDTLKNIPEDIIKHMQYISDNLKWIHFRPWNANRTIDVYQGDCHIITLTYEMMQDCTYKIVLEAVRMRL